MFWLAVERYENWKTDFNNKFTFLGLSKKKLKSVESMKAGDFIIGYVSSGVSSFLDIREVISDKPQKFKYGLVYDNVFDYQIETRPYHVLSEKDWINIHDFIGRLSFLPKNKQWGQTMRNSMRKLNESDAKLIVDSIKIKFNLFD